MRSKIINDNVAPYEDGEFRIEYHGGGADGCWEGFSGTLHDAIAHGADEGQNDGAERVSVWGKDTINGNVLDKIGAMAFPS